METVEFQSFVFMYTLYGGILIGIFYDIYRVLRGRRRSDKLFKSIFDAVFLLLILLIFVWAIFSSNYGELRAYVFIGYLVGFLLYEKILGRIAVGIFYYIKNTVIHFYKTSNSIILLPFRLMFNLLWYILDKIFRFFSARKRSFYRIKKLPSAILSHNSKYFRLIFKKNKSKK
ncbi:MAG: spore cortex biosynthesis protein YabQ [Bacillota bacterium]